jgi:hypothetical protein
MQPCQREDPLLSKLPLDLRVRVFQANQRHTRRRRRDRPISRPTPRSCRGRR